MPLWGAIQEMKKSYEQNKAMLKSRGSLKEKLKETGAFTSSAKKLNFKEVSEDELALIRKKFRKKAKESLKKQIVVFLILAGLVALLFYFMLT